MLISTIQEEILLAEKYLDLCKAEYFLQYPDIDLGCSDRYDGLTNLDRSIDYSRGYMMRRVLWADYNLNILKKMLDSVNDDVSLN